MPVKSSNSSVIKWPSKDDVKRALLKWLPNELKKHPEVTALGVIGSFTTDRWGVGSDLDIIVIEQTNSLVFHERAADWDTLSLPVPVDLLIYTEDEWTQLQKENARITKEVKDNAIWFFEKSN